ncbi:MAG: hypothetical protein HUJ13_08225, partial [Hydrogenovibrio crunogenus]|nr:hypothetical protein [Hydrogenovibrio crunogenus]
QPLNESPEVSDLLELPDAEKKEHQSPEQEQSKKKNLKPVLIVMLLVLLVAAGLAIFASFQIGEVIDNNSLDGKTENKKLSPLDIQNISLNDAAPKKQNEPQFQKVDKKESSNLLNGVEMESDEIQVSKTPPVKNKPEQAPSSSIEDNLPNDSEGLMTDLDVREKQTLDRIESLENTVEAIRHSTHQLNQNLSNYSQQAAFNDRELSDIKSSIRSVNNKVKRVSYLVKKQERKTLTKQVKNPKPPKISSFATWNGRNAVYVEYPKGKLTMLYEGDIVNSWKVVSINQIKQEAKFQKGKRTVIGGKK